jgi:hypothetical protein
VRDWLADGHHLVRACMWLLLVPVIFTLGWQDSVVVVFLYSTYANFSGDLGIWKGAQAKREAKSSS